MAGIIASVVTGGTEIALVGATAKTVLQLTAPANQRLKILGFGVFFDGIVATAEPVEIRVLRQTTAGTATSVTPRMISAGSETLQATANKNASAEPTAGDELDVLQVHPQSGYEVMFPPGQELIIPGGGRIGIEVTAPVAVNCNAKMRYEE